MDCKERFGVSKEYLSKRGKEVLEELAKASEIMQGNVSENRLELIAAEMLVKYEDMMQEYNEEVRILRNLQGTLKDSVLILNSLNSLDGDSFQHDLNLEKSLIVQTKELEERLFTQKCTNYSEEIDHRALMNFGDECEKIAKELVTLQEKSEKYGDFPTVTFTQNTFQGQQLLISAEAELEELEDLWTQKVNSLFD